MQQRAFVTIGGVIFAVVSLAHLVRLILAWQVIIGPYTVPFWISGGGFVFAGALAIWACIMLLSGDGLR